MEINTYLSIITIKDNGLNDPIKRHSGSLDKSAKAYNILCTKSAKAYNILCTRDSPQDKGHKQIEIEGMGKDISCQ